MKLLLSFIRGPLPPFFFFFGSIVQSRKALNFEQKKAEQHLAGAPSLSFPFLR